MDKEINIAYELNVLMKEIKNTFVLTDEEKELLFLRFGLTQHGNLTIEEISKITNRSCDEIKKNLMDSLNKFHSYRRNHIYNLRIPNEGQYLSEYSDFDEVKKQLNSIIELYTPLEQEAMSLRYGLKDGKPKTIKEVSDILNIKEKQLKSLLYECTRKFRGFTPYDSRNIKLINYELDEKLKRDLYKNLSLFNEFEKVLLSLRFGFNGFDVVHFDVLSRIFNRIPEELIKIELEAIEKYYNFKIN